MARLVRLSARLARLELWLAGILAGLVTLLILLNVFTRAVDGAIYWVDEAAIYAMIWMALLATSAALARREAIAVALIYEFASTRLARVVGAFVDIVVLVFAGAMLWLTWLWFSPAALARAGFDLMAFQGATFNFIYAEPTLTLGIKKVWVWLIVPIFALHTSVHALANIVERARPAEGHAASGVKDAAA